MTRPFPEVEGVEVTHRFVAARGFTFHVAEAGPPHAPPLLLLHGWPQHWYSWHKVLPALAAEYRVVMPDLRGFGWSDAPARGYEKENLGDDVLAILDELELPRVKLLAHDWGGWVGYLLALRAPERFERFVVLNIPPPWGGGRPSSSSGKHDRAIAARFRPLTAPSATWAANATGARYPAAIIAPQ